MTFKTLSNLRSSKFIGWGRHLATVRMLLVNNQWFYCERCHFCHFFALHWRRTWPTHILRTPNEAKSRKLLRALPTTRHPGTLNIRKCNGRQMKFFTTSIVLETRKSHVLITVNLIGALKSHNTAATALEQYQPITVYRGI